MKQNYKECLKRLLEHEGGNDDDPRDPGGRTSRGITQREWVKYEKEHPELPDDVWKAPQVDVEAIYKRDYWDAQNCDDLPPGLDYSVFDYGVHSGIRRSGRVLQRLLGIHEDGIIGPVTIAEAKKHDPIVLIINMNDERMRFLRSLKHFVTYGKGWTRRVEDVRKFSIELAKQPQPQEQGIQMSFPFNIINTIFGPEKIAGWVRAAVATGLGFLAAKLSAVPFFSELLTPEVIASLAALASTTIVGLWSQTAKTGTTVVPTATVPEGTTPVIVKDKK